jgi:ubiquinone/menaquinone biosynthesis C-methylase UbiE
VTYRSIVSVSSHLAIDVREYDSRIRTFIPDYETMLDAVARLVAARRPRVVVDLGTGTGALAARVLRAARGASIVGIDQDEAMLATARRRMARRRVRLVQDSFLRAPFPACDAFIASLALHHIEQPRDKRALFARARRALRGGGVLVSADCHPPSSPSLAAEGFEEWARHLAAHYGRKGAQAFLRAWADEDFYTTLETELQLLLKAGFTADVVWRHGLFAVVVGTA